jgi:hypothetical protein
MRLCSAGSGSSRELAFLAGVRWCRLRRRVAYRGDWLAAAGIAVAVLIPVALQVRNRLLTTRATMRRHAELSAELADIQAARTAKVRG